MKRNIKEICEFEIECVNCKTKIIFNIYQKAIFKTCPCCEKPLIKDNAISGHPFEILREAFLYAKNCINADLSLICEDFKA